MRNHSALLLRLLQGSVRWGAAGAIVAGLSCAEDLDTHRQGVSGATLGDDIYEMLCDRVGAQSLGEDVDGSSYDGICHPNATGQYAMQVDRSHLPSPVDADAAHLLELGVAKVEAMARRRAELIDSLNAALPDTALSDTRTLHDALRDFAQRLIPLYNDDTLPNVTRVLGNLADGVEARTAAHDALARFASRRGYQPYATALGAVAPTLSYDRIIELSRAGLAPILPHTDATDPSSPPGPAHRHLVKLLEAGAEEMRTTDVTPPAGSVRVLPSGVVSRPRSTAEILYTLSSGTGSTLPQAGGAPLWMVHRDERGIAIPSGTLLDADGDGLYDTDALGFPLGHTGMDYVSPFSWFAVNDETRDANGAAIDASGAPVWQTYDGSQSVIASSMATLHQLTTPGTATAPSLLSGMLLGLMPLLGDRALPDCADPDNPASSAACTVPAGANASTKDYEAADGSPATTVHYDGFLTNTSPLFALGHAIAMLVGDPRSEDLFALTEQLATNHPQELARVIGAMLTIKQIVDKDIYKNVSLPEKSMFWDDMLDVVGDIAKEPKLLEDVVRSMLDDDTVKAGPTFASMLTFKDEMTYDPNNLNGPALNLTIGGGSTADPSTPVDRTQPETGTNRSLFYRLLGLTRDTSGVVFCNKFNATVHAKDLPAIGDQDYPGTAFPGPLQACQVFRVDDVAELYVDSLAGFAHIVIRDPNISAADDHTQEVSSGITGMTLHPVPTALHRWNSYVFAPLGVLTPDAIAANDRTRTYMADLMDPPATLRCPLAQPPVIDKYLHDVVPLRDCSSTPEKGFWPVWGHTLMAFDRLNFTEASKPLARAFAYHQKASLFTRLLGVLYKHWGDGRQGADECTTKPDDPFYCSGDGLVKYAPLLVEALQTDLLPALNALTKATAQTFVQSRIDGTEVDGVHVLAEALRGAVDPDRASARGVTDAAGMAMGQRNDGTAVQQTPLRLVIDALKAVDARYAADAAANPNGLDRKTLWRTARSKLVDTFAGVDGTGATATFHNPAAPIATAVGARLLHDQVNARCAAEWAATPPACTWADTDLTTNLSDTLGGPLVSEGAALLEAFLDDANARGETEQFIDKLLDPASPGFGALAAGVVDLPIVVNDGSVTGPLLQSLAPVIRPPPANSDAVPAVDALLTLLQRMTSEDIDPDHISPILLKGLVTNGGPGKPAPLEVFLDIIGDIERYDSGAVGAPIDQRDAKTMVDSFKRLMLDPVRGLEQFYAVVRYATSN